MAYPPDPLDAPIPPPTVKRPRRAMTTDEWAKFASYMFVIGAVWGTGIGYLLRWWLG